MRSIAVIGLGNAMRGDDAAGVLVARRLLDGPLPGSVTVAVHEGEAIELLELWEGADAVVLVDTVRSGAPAGTVHRIDASAEPIPAVLRRASSHTIGAAEVIELARVLGRLPRTVLVYGIEGRSFDAGASLSSEVAAALDELHAMVAREAAELAA